MCVFFAFSLPARSETSEACEEEIAEGLHAINSRQAILYGEVDLIVAMDVCDVFVCVKKSFRQTLRIGQVIHK